MTGHVEGSGARRHPLHVFVSAPDVLLPPAADLIAALRAVGMSVEHSPSDGKDPRFSGWYDFGLSAAVERCDVFVVVPVTWWDSSTWMAIEAEAGMRRTTEPDFLYCAWRPVGVESPKVALGMRPYLENAPLLPGDPRRAAAALLSRV